MEKQFSYRPFLIAIIAALGMAALMLGLDFGFPKGGALWRGWLTEHSTIVYFCEPASLKALFRHKIDTYTNLGFFFVAVVILAYGRLDRKLSYQKPGFAVVHPAWSHWFGIALLCTFAGSTFFHASLTLSGEALDLAGVYAAALLPGFFNLHGIRSLRRKRRLPAKPYLLAWAVFWLLSSLLIFTVSSRIVVGTSLLLIGGSGFYLFIQVKARRGWGFAASSVGLTLVAAMFFVMDIQRVGCDPQSWYQAHGIWHLLAATSSGLYYAFMRKLHF